MSLTLASETKGIVIYHRTHSYSIANYHGLTRLALRDSGLKNKETRIYVQYKSLSGLLRRILTLAEPKPHFTTTPTLPLFEIFPLRGIRFSWAATL